jgi:anti-sigma factor RsiW
VDCARVDEELIAFELAALDGAKRAAVETHLTGCARCVSSFLALKRAIDAGEDASAPSEMVRARVRAEAVKQLAIDAGRAAAATKAPAAVPERRAPWMAVAFAAAAAILAPVMYQALSVHKAPALRGAAVETGAPNVVPVKADETVDTARVTPANLAFL